MTVRMVGIDLAIWDATRQHYDALFREFALVAGSDPAESTAIPRRLTALVDELRERFSGFTVGQNDTLEDALAAGETTLDLEFQIPAEAGAAAVDLEAMLDEAEEYCQSGDLLTLLPSPEVKRFRQWYLAEFVDQLAGRSPTPFAEWPLRG